MLFLITAGSLAFASSVVDSSKCIVVTATPVPTWQERVDRADEVFTAVAIERAPKMPSLIVDDTLSFLIEKRWKGDSADTARVILRTSGCPAFVMAGRMYLVIANRQGGELVITAGTPVPSLFPEDSIWRAHLDTLGGILGRPRWTAPPVSQRSYDRTPPAVRTLGGATLIVSLPQIYRDVPGVAVEIVGTGQIAPRRNGSMYSFEGLSPGFIYRVRLHLPGGIVEEHYARTRCDPDYAGGCYSSRAITAGHASKRVAPS